MRFLIALLLALCTTAASAAPPCYYGIPKDGWDAVFPRWGYDSGVLWAAWTCYPTAFAEGSTAASPGVFVFLGGPLSFNTFGPRLQAIRTAPDPLAAADAAWAAYVKVDAATDPVLRPVFERAKRTP